MTIQAKQHIDPSVDAAPKPYQPIDYLCVAITSLFFALIFVNLGPIGLSDRFFEAEILKQAASQVRSMAFSVIVATTALGCAAIIASGFLTEKKPKWLARSLCFSEPKLAHWEKPWRFLAVAAAAAGVGCIIVAALIQNNPGMQVLSQDPTDCITSFNAYLDGVLVTGIALTTLSALALWLLNKKNTEPQTIELN